MHLRHTESRLSPHGSSIPLQIKYDKDIECGGGYLKMGPKIENPENFGDPTPYNIMFGPDKCGYTKRTHLIFNYNGKNQLKTADIPYKQDKDGVSNLYRLVLKPDNSVEVLIDNESVYKVRGGVDPGLGVVQGVTRCR